MPRFTFEIVKDQSDETEIVTVDLAGPDSVHREIVLTVNGMMNTNDEITPEHLTIRVRDDRGRLVAECVTTLKLFPV